MTGENSGPSTESDRPSTGARIANDLRSYTNLTGEFYRGEVDRTTSWRARLDQTTNWAVVVVAAILTWAFSSADHPHYVILIGVFGVSTFLVMEANRYREYDVWRGRLRTLQEDLLADVYAPGRGSASDWEPRLSEALRNPTFSLSFREALTHRLRRSYLPLLLILLAAWIARILLLEPNEPWEATAGILAVPGPVVVALVGAFYLLVVSLTAWSARGERVQEFQE